MEIQQRLPNFCLQNQLKLEFLYICYVWIHSKQYEYLNILYIPLLNHTSNFWHKLCDCYSIARIQYNLEQLAEHIFHQNLTYILFYKLYILLNVRDVLFLICMQDNWSFKLELLHMCHIEYFHYYLLPKCDLMHILNKNWK